jgi:hypothetical protein
MKTINVSNYLKNIHPSGDALSNVEVEMSDQRRACQGENNEAKHKL